jgi:hypothetical protein
MMKSSNGLEPGELNRATRELQLELYKFVLLADKTYNFPNGLDVYYNMLNTLNKHIQ